MTSFVMAWWLMMVDLRNTTAFAGPFVSAEECHRFGQQAKRVREISRYGRNVQELHCIEGRTPVGTVNK